MMNDRTMREALGARPEAVALACMDTRSGLLLGIQVRGDVPRDDVEIAAYSAAELCTAPSIDDVDTSSGEECDETFVASSRWVHAYARVPTRRDLVVVGLAPGDANVALLRAWIRQVAAQVGPEA
ncbi:MAG: hypothetical protein JST00_16920 [Deltaproteobacteria bacterium]|nr:hypothetical protein [Deltaproteobacteria bacterium]